MWQECGRGLIRSIQLVILTLLEMGKITQKAWVTPLLGFHLQTIDHNRPGAQNIIHAKSAETVDLIG